jgi:hypothetical protein
MTPALKVKFRKRNGIPFAVERLSGIQYRCRACNKIFFEKKELDAHLESEVENHRSRKSSVEAPKTGENLTIRVLYALDLLDSLKREYFRSEREEYGEPWE